MNPEQSGDIPNKNQLATKTFVLPSGRVIEQKYGHQEGNSVHTISQTLRPSGVNTILKNTTFIEQPDNNWLHPWMSTVSCWLSDGVFVDYSFHHNNKTQREIEINNPFRTEGEAPVIKLFLGSTNTAEFYPKPRKAWFGVSEFTSAQNALEVLRISLNGIFADNPRLLSEIEQYDTASDFSFWVRKIDANDEQTRRRLQNRRNIVTAMIKMAYRANKSEDSQRRQAQALTFLNSIGLSAQLLTPFINWNVDREELIKTIVWHTLQHVHEFTEKRRASEFLIAEFGENNVQVAKAKMSDLPILQEEIDKFKTSLPKTIGAYNTPIPIEDGYAYVFHKKGKVITATLVKGEANIVQSEVTFTIPEKDEFDLLMTGVEVDYGELLTSSARVTFASPMGIADTATLLGK